MGNEQAIPEQGAANRIPGQPSYQPKPRRSSNLDAAPASHEMLIMVRGQRSTGKTTLIKRMKGGGFNPEYEPTPFLEAYDVPYKSELIKEDLLNVKVWDVVEKALLPSNADTKMLTPDASTIDCNKRADGIVIIIDSRHFDTVQLADKIIDETPLDLPILIFSNFMDLEEVRPTIPPLLQNKIGRFTYIPGSFKTNQGLFELSKWLVIPYTYSKKKQYLALYNKISEDLEDILRESHEDAVNFITLESARKHAPQLPMRPPTPKTQTPPPKTNTPPPKTNTPPPTQKVTEEEKPPESQPQRESPKEGNTVRRQKVHIKTKPKIEKPQPQKEEIKPKPKPITPPKTKTPEPVKEADDFWGDNDDEPDNDDFGLPPPDSSSDEDRAPNPHVVVNPQKRLPLPMSRTSPISLSHSSMQELPSDEDSSQKVKDSQKIEDSENSEEEAETDSDDIEMQEEAPSFVTIPVRRPSVLEDPPEMPKIDDGGDEGGDGFWGDDDDDNDDGFGNMDAKIEIKPLPPLESLQQADKRPSIFSAPPKAAEPEEQEPEPEAEEAEEKEKEKEEKPVVAPVTTHLPTPSPTPAKVENDRRPHRRAVKIHRRK